MNESIVGLELTLTRESSVPCGSCRLCCQGRTAVMILPDHGDDPAAFDTFEIPKIGAHFLNHKPNGDCVYLGAEGCTIHGRAPFMCRTFDCREQHRMYTKAQRATLVAQGRLDPRILRRGAILLHQAHKTMGPAHK